jgi:hypothetical protein
LEGLFDWQPTMYARDPHIAVVSTSMSMDLLPYARMKERKRKK